MTSAIQVHDLHKTFGHTVALDGLDLDVADRRDPRLPRPQRRRQVDDAAHPARPAARRRRHAPPSSAATRGARSSRCTAGSPTCPATSPSGPTSPGGEVIDILARLRGGVDEKRRASMLERFDLDPTKKGRSYSKGNRQKVALVAALSSDVELLLLDEPTSGLDPLMEAVFREVVREFRQAGGTVLLSSHILSEVEQVCDRVSIIREGRNVESGTLTELRHLSRTTVRATLAQPRRRGADLGAARRRRRPRVRRPRDVHRRQRRPRAPARGARLARHHGPDERSPDARGALHGAVPLDPGGGVMTTACAAAGSPDRRRPDRDGLAAAPRRAPRPGARAGQRLRPRRLRRAVGPGDVRPLPRPRVRAGVDGADAGQPRARRDVRPDLEPRHRLDRDVQVRAARRRLPRAARLRRRPAPHAYRGGGRATRAARRRRRRSPRGAGGGRAARHVRRAAHRCPHGRLVGRRRPRPRRLGRPRRLVARHGPVVGRRHGGRRPADLEHPRHGRRGRSVRLPSRSSSAPSATPRRTTARPGSSPGSRRSAGASRCRPTARTATGWSCSGSRSTPSSSPSRSRCSIGGTSGPGCCPAGRAASAARSAQQAP